MVDSQRAGPPADSKASGPHPQGAGRWPVPAGNSGAGAPPSNTAPANCRSSDGSPIRILRVGIDSLYLSFPGQLDTATHSILQKRKECARSPLEREQAAAIHEIKGHRFEVRDKGSRSFAFVLRDAKCRIEVSSAGSERLPLAHVQVGSEWLINHGVRKVIDELTEVVSELSLPDGPATVSRADLYVDFVCGTSFDSFPLAAWVSRAKRISQHSMNRAFTGYTVGLGGDISARIYDKTREIEESGKAYMKRLWSAQGWDGDATVWRLEFQFRRSVLKEHGVDWVDSLLARLGPLWRYATTSWLRLTVPSKTDSTKSRWPLHPVWDALAATDWPSDIEGISVPVRNANRPSEDRLFAMGLSWISAYMAVRGITDAREAGSRYLQEIADYFDEEAMLVGLDYEGFAWQRAAVKARRYNLPFTGIDEEVAKENAEIRAKAYRKARDGE